MTSSKINHKLFQFEVEEDGDGQHKTDGDDAPVEEAAEGGGEQGPELLQPTDPGPGSTRAGERQEQETSQRHHYIEN